MISSASGESAASRFIRNVFSPGKLQPVFEPVANRRTIFGQLMFFGSWLFITVVGAVLSPSAAGHGTHQELGLPPCPCVLIFNRPCPGCGLTTSFTALLHGRFREAFKAHWFGPLLYLIFTVGALMAGYAFLKRKRFEVHQRPIQNFLMVFTIVFVVYGVVRFAVMNHYQTPVEAGMASGLYPQG